jgi:hypothetical protein
MFSVNAGCIPIFAGLFQSVIAMIGDPDLPMIHWGQGRRANEISGGAGRFWQTRAFGASRRRQPMRRVQIGRAPLPARVGRDPATSEAPTTATAALPRTAADRNAVRCIRRSGVKPL